jgi:hypothetical protein
MKQSEFVRWLKSQGVIIVEQQTFEALPRQSAIDVATSPGERTEDGTHPRDQETTWLAVRISAHG